MAMHSQCKVINELQQSVTYNVSFIVALLPLFLFCILLSCWIEENSIENGVFAWLFY